MNPTAPTPDLRSIRALLFDMDGVLYVGPHLLPGVAELLAYLDATDRRYLCVTNNASLTSVDFAQRLDRMGVQVAPEHILGSAEATAAWLAEQVKPEANGAPIPIVVNGMTGLKATLTAYGFDVTDDPTRARYVVSGINFEMTYEDIARCTVAIRNGAEFIGTNPDVTIPTERGILPGAGALQAAIVAATGAQPRIVGKPHAPMFELAMARLGVSPAETLMVGDRYDTDIAGALALGLQTAAVLTGVTTAAEFAAAEPPPHLVVGGLVELLGVLRTADEGAVGTSWSCARTL